MTQSLREKTIPGLHESLVRHLPPNRDGAVLDIGCGTGAWLERLFGHGYRNLYGIDAELSQIGSTNAQFVRADLEADEIHLDGRKFQLITAIEVIEHIENTGRLFSLVESHLADDGLFLLTTPNVHSLHSRLRFLLKGELQFFDGKADETHVTPIVLTGLERMLARHGLRIRRSWSFPEHGGSIASRKSLRLVSKMLALVFPNPIPGDILCVLIEKSSRRESLASPVKDPQRRDCASCSEGRYP